ncbi:MAG: metallophosphoesterase family protein [Pseudomonadota bacterium]
MFQKSKNGAAAPDGKRFYAIGDIHGAADALDRLIDRIDAEKAGDVTKELVFLGDYVDRGPDSKGVIERLIAIGAEFPGSVFLKGNHEAVMLDFLNDPEEMLEWLEWGGDETLRSYGVSGALTKSGEDLSAELASAMPKAHLDFLNNLSLTHQAGDYLFVHAGVRPGVALKDQSEDDLLWIRKRFHDANAKDRPDFTVVHGHHPMKKPVDVGWRIGVDTGACWSGVLTAAVLEGKTRRFIASDSR